MTAAAAAAPVVPEVPVVEEKKLPVLTPSQQVCKDIFTNLAGISNAVKRRDQSKLTAISRHNSNLRSALSPRVLTHVLTSSFPADDEYAQSLLQVLDSIMVTDDDDTSELPKFTIEDVVVEMHTYVHLLLVYYLVDTSSTSLLDSITGLIQRLASTNRRTLDSFYAKALFYYSLAHERNGTLASIRVQLLGLYRSACLRSDEPGQAVLINLILRNFLQFNLYTQAEQFLLNTEFPPRRSNYQCARYYYYVGRINAMQLNYSGAFDNLSQAVRRAPQAGATGFRVAAHKLLVIVQLLLGEIPARSVFQGQGMSRALAPYFQITQAVRLGDLGSFSNTLETHLQTFIADGTHSLIVRLRHNVIKTGLRKISLSYSKISLEDITAKLKLPSVADAEYVISKAIHDGALEAEIDRDNKSVASREIIDIYSTEEPQQAFNRRIKFCLDIHNEAVKAMRFPDEKEEEDGVEENEFTLEMAIAMLEGEEEDGMDMD